MSKIDEILKVLDMKSEKEQEDWLWDRKLIHEDESLASLAFRLRDEAEPHEFDLGLYEVYLYLKIADVAFGFWARAYCKPIHWIIAALIAKELAKENANGQDR